MTGFNQYPKSDYAHEYYNQKWGNYDQKYQVFVKVHSKIKRVKFHLLRMNFDSTFKGQIL